MRFLVTDVDKEIKNPDVFVITTRHERGRELEKRHVPVYCVKEVVSFVGYGTIEKQLDELINHQIAKVIKLDELRILWNVILDAQDGIFGLLCKQAMEAVDEWTELLKQKPEEIVFEVSNSNRVFCLIGKMMVEKHGIPRRIIYASWKEKVRGIKPEYTCLSKMYQNFIRHRNIINLIFHSKAKGFKEKHYQFGFVLASDALRIFQWSMPIIKSAIKAFGRNEIRILCIDCDQTYHKFVHADFPCDNLTDWFDKKIVGKEEREYKTYRKLLSRYIHENLTYTYHGFDMTQMIVGFFDQYLWCEKATHYRLKMIYESYFSRNAFWCIEPWSTTRYYQTNICCLASSESKHCRVNGEPIFYKQESFREVYPNFFDFIFFPDVGFDLREDCYEPNRWGKQRFYASIKNSSIMQTWSKNKDKNYRGIKSIAVLPGGIYTERNISETDKILDCLEGFHVICKFHPQLANHPSVQEYIKKGKMGVTFIAANENVQTVIEMADIVVTMFSTVMLDAMASHKVCILIPNEEEKNIVSYMEQYLTIWNVSQLQEKFREIASDDEKSKDWYREQLKKQDAFFEEDEMLEDAYTQLKKIYEEQK